MQNQSNSQDRKVTLDAIRARLAQAQGPHYWRSLEELLETEQVREILEDEFPRQLMAFNQPIDRRHFLKLIGASLALAGLSACTRQPEEKIVPYVKAPEEVIPGKPLFYATAFTLGGFATGVLAESHLGRPTKIEGNPDHPASLGATDLFAQASIWMLYDPDRSQVTLQQGEISSWEAFLSAARTELAKQRGKRGAGVRILTETVTSPTLAEQLRAFLKQYPEAKWHQYEPVNRDNLLAGAQLAFGEYVHPVYHLDRADVVLALDADFLFAMPGSVRYAREFADRRRVRVDRGEMNRLYVVESAPTVTGSVADHRWSLRPSQIEIFARALAQQLGVLSEAGAKPEVEPHLLEALARDLQSHRGRCVVIAGESQPPSVHALAHAMNFYLGNVGSTVVYTAPAEANPIQQTESLRELVEAMQAGKVEVLLILGGNPVFTAPADLPFAELLPKVNFSVHLSLYEDETSALCQWHTPEAHYLEAWSDARAYDGTVSIIQPLIEPLFGGKSAHELLAALMGQPANGYEIIKNYWKKQLAGNKGRVATGEPFEQYWQKVLHDGLVPGTALPPKQVALKPEWQQAIASQPVEEKAEGLEIVFQPDPTIWDGRFANNGWLQEIPKPLTKLTWDNAVLISPKTAEQQGLIEEFQAGWIGQDREVPLVEVRYQDRTVVAPVWILPGHPDGVITINLGYGRSRAGQVGTGIGFNAYAIRTAAAPYFDKGAELHKTGAKYQLVSTQHHHAMRITKAPLEDESSEAFQRGIIQILPLEEFRKLGSERSGSNGTHAAGAHGHREGKLPSLYSEEEHKYDGYAWGMVIDTTVCIGCNACIVACQAENNIPVVGKREVARGREMHWLRVDRYFKGTLENPEVVHMAVPCMQCENAPCEPVCPVGATVHSKEGLNQMVYNRCVGTRYCSNNCPYKVRRFNFYKYTAGIGGGATNYDSPLLKMLANPDVTIRGRGVMEKCTYCVQRINLARIEAKKEGRLIQDKEVLTACQQVCPTQAIIFGDLHTPESEVAQLRREPHHYTLLEELNTRPRTTYLAKVRNPNPEIEKG